MKRWPTKLLGDLVNFIGGGTPRRDRLDYWGGDIPWASVKDLQSQSLERTVESITPDGLANSATNLIPEGTVIIATRVGLGKVTINRKPVAINQDLKALTLRSNDLLPRFLLFFFLSKAKYFERTGIGATVKGLTIADYQKLKIPLPPLTAQERIVHLLDEADELRKLRAQANRRTTALIPALFHEMFGDPATNPLGWPKGRLGELCELINGAPFKPTDWDGAGLPIIRIQNLNDATKPFNCTSKQLPEKFRVQPGNILLSWSGTPGTSFGCFRWNGPEGWLNQHIFNVKLARGLNGEFFIQSVNARLTELIAKAHGGVGLQHVTKGVLNSLEILIPPLSLQEQFAMRVTEIRVLEAEQASSRRRLDDLFQSLLHREFQGDL